VSVFELISFKIILTYSQGGISFILKKPPTYSQGGISLIPWKEGRGCELMIIAKSKSFSWLILVP